MHVLLVEDSDEVSCITVEYLQELGHEVTAVGSAEEAIPKIAESGIDILMTDVRLPGISGLELAKHVVKTYPKLPVIIASGFGSIDVGMLTGDKLSKISSLPKPYDMDELHRTLNAAMRPSV